MTVVGACARETILTGVDAPVPAVVLGVSSTEPGVLRNATIEAPGQAGASTDGAHALALEGVVVRGTTPFGVVSFGGGELSLTDVYIAETAPLDGSGGYPISVNRAQLVAERVVADRGVAAGFVLTNGSSAELRDVAIADTRLAATGTPGRGMILQTGSTISAAGLYMSGNPTLSIDASGEGTTLTLEDVLLADTQPPLAGMRGGTGIQAQNGVELTATRMVVANTSNDGIFAEHATVTLDGVILRDGEPRPGTGLFGRGIELGDGVHLSVDDLLISRVHEVGIYLLGDSTVELADVAIRDVSPNTVDGGFGMGIIARNGSQITAQRLVVERISETGVAVDFDATVEVVDALIRDVSPVVDEGNKGRGVQVQRGARLDAARLRVEDVSELGIAAAAGATVELSDVRVSNVAYPPCATDGCPDARFAHGLLAASSRLTANRFAVDTVGLCGVFLGLGFGSSDPPEVDLSTGVVSNAEIGACVNLESYDLARLSDEVVFRDNDTNLESTSLPVPGTVDSTAGASL